MQREQPRNTVIRKTKKTRVHSKIKHYRRGFHLVGGSF
jgi:hypothetical protein